MNRRRLITITTAGVLTLIGTWIIVTYVNNAEERAAGNEELTNILVPEEEIPAGTTADEMQGLVTVQSIPADLRPSDAVTELAEVGDQVTDVKLLPGEPIRRERFVDRGQGGPSGGTADEGDQVVSIALDAQRALGGDVRAGQRVGVVISMDQAEIPDDENPGQTRIGETLTGFVLNDIPVVAKAGGDEGGGGIMVSLSVDQSEAGRIIFGAEHGRIWLTEQNEQTVTAGGRIRTRDNIYQGTNEDS